MQWEHTQTQLSAINVTAQAFIERLYLILGLSPFSSQNSYWDYYGSFEEQRLFFVKFARFRNFFDSDQFGKILAHICVHKVVLWQISHAHAARLLLHAQGNCAHSLQFVTGIGAATSGCDRRVYEYRSYRPLSMHIYLFWQISHKSKLLGFFYTNIAGIRNGILL